MSERGAILDKDLERQRAARKELKKFKGAGAGPGATATLEAQRQMGALYEALDIDEDAESTD